MLPRSGYGRSQSPVAALRRSEGSQNETTDSDRSVVGYAAIGALTQSYMRRESVDEQRYAICWTGRAQGHDRRGGSGAGGGGAVDRRDPQRRRRGPAPGASA